MMPKIERKREATQQAQEAERQNQRQPTKLLDVITGIGTLREPRRGDDSVVVEGVKQATKALMVMNPALTQGTATPSISGFSRLRFTRRSGPLRARH